MNPLYEEDFHAWLESQIKLIKSKEFDKLDTEHLIEEMEDLGSSSKEAIESHLAILLLHLLKLKMQPTYASKSWHDSIKAAKEEIQWKIEDHPSLHDHPGKSLKKSYERAKRLASKQTDIDLRKFPKECPWTIEEVLGE